MNPIAINVEAGKIYWWCRCGRKKTASPPLCDGSHNSVAAPACA
jgi:CDGSH iron-sulfur domain-containing protein 3